MVGPGLATTTFCRWSANSYHFCGSTKNELIGSGTFEPKPVRVFDQI
jgi:hypothetical protein